MAKRMRALGAAGLIAAVGMVAVAAQQSEPKKEVVETKSEVSRGKDDPNIKSTAARVNSAKAEKPAPASKGGEKPRGAIQTCDVHIDNRTPWYIHIYIDGDYSGLVPPWGDLYDRAIAGATVFYGKANFDDGSSRTWGPSRFPCPAGYEYTWRLYR